ncbi:MAG: M43 family zinc metalloprotease [Saprospiraceae bacterium]
MPNLHKFLFLLLFSSLFSVSITAQRSCGFDAEHHEKLKDPVYQAFIKQMRSEVAKALADDSRIPCSNGVITFPVAIHYDWPGAPAVPDQCMIDAAMNSIAAMNLDYSAGNTDVDNYDDLTATCSTYYPASAKSDNSCIQFCIAEYDHPNCSGLCDGEKAITSGLFSYPSTGGCYSDMINIFVGFGESGNLGVAPLNGVNTLGGNGPFVAVNTWGGSGVTCTASGAGVAFNALTQYNLGRTLTHEMGHYFGLDHVFNIEEDNSIDTTGIGICAWSQDNIGDTPAQSVENGGKPVVINCDPNNVGNTANNTCGTLDMWCSFMDYSDDTHLFMFTTDQSTAMYANAMTAPIADSAIKCNSIAEEPTADLNVLGDLPVFCTYDNAPYTIDFEDNSTRCPNSWVWSFSGTGVSPTSSTMENPTVTVTAAGELTVTLISTNAVGSSTQVTKTVTVSIAPAGSCPDCGPTFTDSGGPNSDYSDNEENTWTYCADAGMVLNFDFSSLDLDNSAPFINENDLLYIKYGPNPPMGDGYFELIADSDLIGAGGSILNSDLSGASSLVVSPGECVSFLFVSTGSATSSGWNVPIECKSPESCTDGMQNQDEEFVDCGGTNCPECPSACGFTFTDKGGVDGDFSLTENGTQWLLCADEADQILNLDFSLFQSGGAALLIFDGDIVLDNSNIGTWMYNVQQGGYFTAGAGYSTSNPLPSAGQCFTFYYSVPPTATINAGFETLVSCCNTDNCPYANTAGETFDETVDNYCNTNTITDIGSALKGGFDSNSRDCNTLANNQTFYEVTCDSDGGLLTVDVGSNSMGGIVDAALYGPVSGACPNYTGVNQVACDSGMDPAPISVMANADDVYLVVVATENKGAIDVVGTGSALGQVLPIELEYFSAKAKGKNVVLLWLSSVEINNDYYTIAKSNDGVNYTEYAEIPGSGDEIEGDKYEFVDSRAFTGMNYYRLSQTDLDGTSKIVGYANADITVAVSPFTIYPNPSASNKLTLSGLNPNRSYNITVINSVGYSTQLVVSSDESGEYLLNTNDISNGVYYIKVASDSEYYTTKFVKLK